MRISRTFIPIFVLLLCALNGSAQTSTPLPPTLGPAPVASRALSALPRESPVKLDVTGGFNVNGSSREQVRQFYNAVYTSSDNVLIDSTANSADCVTGTNSVDFQGATLRRINWFRALSGIPAAVTFSASESVADQSAALMMSANEQLLHNDIPPSWSCFDASGTNAAEDSNLALDLNGPDAITGYIWDYGAANPQVGHRRWLLYPQTQVMATGDMPAQGNYPAANATWILDANYGGPRPATTWPFVAWPPPGYAPYSVVFPQWSFALSNADLSVASVSMQSNGVPISVVIQPNQSGYGEESVVWYPSYLDPTSATAGFPFNGADTVYSITVNNVRTDVGTATFSYSVTVFDPTLAGADYVATTISGTSSPSVNENNPYSCVPSANPNNTGYQWVAARSTNGNLADNAGNGLTNFTIFPAPLYAIITNPPVGAGKCFHLTHTNPAPQLLELKEVLFPAANTSLSFQSLLGYSTSNEEARVQVSTNGGSLWLDLFTQKGTNGPGQKAFVTHTLSLSNCAGQATLLRFNYDFLGNSYYNQTAPDIGWCLEHILITNANQLVNFTTNATPSTNFDFVPTQTGAWVLLAQGVLFNEFSVTGSPVKVLTVVSTAAPTLLSLGPPIISVTQAQIPFTITQGAAATFQLIEASQIAGPWTTNSSAVLQVLVAGSSFQFTVPGPGGTVFYRVQAQR